MLWWMSAAFAGWPVGPGPALDGPGSGLAFGMTPLDAWKAAPALRPAFDVRMEPTAFRALVAKIPDLVKDRAPGSGGNRWSSYEHVSTTWPEIEGARWSVEFDDRLGLHRVRLHYPEEGPTLAAMRKAWGAPAFDQRWTIWLKPGIRAAYTGCFQPTGGRNECTLELMPYEPLEVVVGRLFPGGKTLVGTPAPTGPRCDDDCVRVTLPPYEFSSGFVPLEATVRDGVVRSYRSALDYTYATDSRDRVVAALGAALGRPGDPQGTCLVWPEKAVRACERSSVFDVAVGLDEAP